MKNTILIFLCMVSAGAVHAQFSRLHVKTSSGSTTGITTGTSANDRVVGISHDGTAGTISTGSLGGGAGYSPLRFLTADQVRMTILENGYIGIGTSTPNVELAVAGKIHGREVRVNVNTGSAPDYVFAKSYKLPPLPEVKAYIQQYSHLPEVPPATAMERDGINLSEMNMLLLKKVEELTLYTIEQNEALAALQQQLAAQQQELAAQQQELDKLKQQINSR